MNYEETEKERVKVSIALREAEITLAQQRDQYLPMKDKERYSSELSRETFMRSRTAQQQAVVDKLRDEAERLADRTMYIVTSLIRNRTAEYLEQSDVND